MDEYRAAVEEWECAFLDRNINALKQRTATYRRMARKEDSDG